jgi:hypothetical protein
MSIDKIYKVIYPIFQPGFCEGVVDIIKDSNRVAIFVTNQLSKNKIEAILDSDFNAEKNKITVEIDLFLKNK